MHVCPLGWAPNFSIISSSNRVIMTADGGSLQQDEHKQVTLLVDERKHKVGVERIILSRACWSVMVTAVVLGTCLTGRYSHTKRLQFAKVWF